MINHYIVIYKVLTCKVLEESFWESNTEIFFDEFDCWRIISFWLLSVMHTMAIDRLKRSIIIWKTPKLHRIVNVNRHDPKNEGFFTSTESEIKNIFIIDDCSYIENWFHLFFYHYATLSCLYHAIILPNYLWPTIDNRLLLRYFWRLL